METPEAAAEEARVLERLVERLIFAWIGVCVLLLFFPLIVLAWFDDVDD